MGYLPDYKNQDLNKKTLTLKTQPGQKVSTLMTKPLKAQLKKYLTLKQKNPPSSQNNSTIKLSSPPLRFSSTVRIIGGFMKNLNPEKITAPEEVPQLPPGNNPLGPVKKSHACSCGQADSRFDYECTNCGDLF